MKNKLLAVCFVVYGLIGCTSIQVNQVAGETISHVCIEENPKVMVVDFVSVLRSRLDESSISSEMYNGKRPASCDYFITYTARRSWDIVPYFSYAEIDMHKYDQIIGSAKFSQSSWSFLKFRSTKSKMTPVIDELLAKL